MALSVQIRITQRLRAIKESKKPRPSNRKRAKKQFSE